MKLKLTFFIFFIAWIEYLSYNGKLNWCKVRAVVSSAAFLMVRKKSPLTKLIR